MLSDIKTKISDITKQVNSDQISSSSIARKIEVLSINLKTTPTILAKDLKIEGTLSSSGMIEIEGEVRGNIHGNSVIIREDGFMEGEIIAESISLRGSFIGNIKAKNIEVLNKAKLVGKVEYGSLCVEDGASIDGQFKKIGT